MKKLIKIYADDCDFCRLLDKTDKTFAKEQGLEFDKIELGDLASLPEENTLRGYVISYHVSSEGEIDVPIYVIVNDGAIQGSGMVTSQTELSQLHTHWKEWAESKGLLS